MADNAVSAPTGASGTVSAPVGAASFVAPDADAFKPFFVRSHKGDTIGYYKTVDEAVEEAETLEMAPFVVYELRASPVTGRVTNGRKAFDAKMGTTEQRP